MTIQLNCSWIGQGPSLAQGGIGQGPSGAQLTAIKFWTKWLLKHLPSPFLLVGCMAEDDEQQSSCSLSYRPLSVLLLKHLSWQWNIIILSFILLLLIIENTLVSFEFLILSNCQRRCQKFVTAACIHTKTRLILFADCVLRSWCALSSCLFSNIEGCISGSLRNIRNVLIMPNPQGVHSAEQKPKG